jgi:glycosyltransferase involved in cell wall biosynthesis
MRVLVVVEGYPDPDGSVKCYFVHVRNRHYVSQGLNVSVLSFSARSDYEIDGIRVYAPHSQMNITYDVVVCHAPNLRHHYRFLRKHGKAFPAIVFFFHGHEVLRALRLYPRAYAFTKQNRLRLCVRDCYDIVKLRIWRYVFSELASKSWFVFVSEWMYDEFLRWVQIDESVIEGRFRIIPNAVGPMFEKELYDSHSPKEYDFMTIRAWLDKSKYAIDIVTELARNNPESRFCVVGKGSFYEYNKKPNNVTVLNKSLTHEEIVELLNASRCGLMPTRLDAQGVMACEFATFGIPLITSDIPICREVFQGFQNVGFISNDNPQVDLAALANSLTCTVDSSSKNRRYCAENTSRKEVELLMEIADGISR